MTKIHMGKMLLKAENGKTEKKAKEIHYYLTWEEEKGSYGIFVSCGSMDEVHIPEISTEKARVQAMLAKMRKGKVTPCTARDIVCDFLCS